MKWNGKRRNNPNIPCASAEPPPLITAAGNVTVSPGSQAVLTCHVVSTVTFNLTWLRGGLDARLDPRVHVLTNLSLRVSGATPDHAGWYECVAANEGGVSAERLYLTVQGDDIVCLKWAWFCLALKKSRTAATTVSFRSCIYVCCMHVCVTLFLFCDLLRGRNNVLSKHYCHVRYMTLPQVPFCIFPPYNSH